MIGDDPVARQLFVIRAFPSDRLRRRDQSLECVRIIIVMHALHHGRDPFQSHARINRWLGQIRSLAALTLIILHEDKVPDLNKPVAILIGAAGRATFDMLTMVVKYLGAWPAWPRVTH